MKWTVSPITGTRRDRTGTRVPTLRAELWIGHHPAHELRGEHGHKVLQGVAAAWNARGFIPSVFSRPTCCADYFTEPARQKFLTESNP